MPSLEGTRPSMEAFSALPPRAGALPAPLAKGDTPPGLKGLCSCLNIQPAMQQPYAQLAAVARDLPVPMRMLVATLPLPKNNKRAFVLCPGVLCCGKTLISSHNAVGPSSLTS